MNKIKYGVLSSAKIADRFIKAIKESDKGILYAVSSRDIKKAKTMSEKYDNVKYYGSYKEICEDKDIDVIYVPTVNKAHFENVNLALDNNKHVVCEKPITLKEDETKKLFLKARSKNLFLMEAQKSVFLPANIKAKNLIKSGEIGEIIYLDYKIFPDYPTFDWFFDKKSGGGAFIGSASYIIQHSEFILGSKIIDYKRQSTYFNNSVDLQSNMIFKFENEALLNGLISVLIKDESKAIIYGTKGKIEINNFWKADKLILSKDLKENNKIFKYPFDYEMVYEINHINDCIEKKIFESPIMLKETSIRSSKIIENISQNLN